ncbi:MAG: hypothetical protein PHE73_08570 [Sulfurovaceae bacterium]|nr:hypothetical protein [Sulfurovaceae bacterium]
MQTYTKKDLLNKSINQKNTKKKTFCLFFNINNFKFGVIYQPNYFTNYHHFDFYCMSLNLEKFTETGYRSIFTGSAKTIYSYRLIKEFLIKEIEAAEINLSVVKPIQLSLF